MKTKTLTKILLASMLCAPACAVEHGVVIYKDKSQSENALYVNLIKKDKSQQKPLHYQAHEMFDADRKLFFADDDESFNCIWAGDTISFRNASHSTFIEMDKKQNRVRDINGMREEDLLKFVMPTSQKQR